jgi:HAE1 family hydrophobic/amphiphilic exporter-1
MREIEEILYENTHIASFVSQTGAGSAFATSDFSGAGSGSSIGNFTVNLFKERKETSDELITLLRKDLASVTSARITVGQPAGGPPSSSPITITFSGDDLGALATTAENATHVLSDIPGVVNIQASVKNLGAEFVVSLDSAKAAELGVSPLSVADTLRTALFSAKATSYVVGRTTSRCARGST